MLKKAETNRAPAAIGPYSQGVVYGGMVYVSGQIPLDPETGEMVSGDVAVQTERAIDNVAAVLAAAGSGLDRVVKTTVFLRDMKDFAAMNEVYARRFCGSVAPARAAVEVSALPKNARVEIETVAFVPDAPSGGVVSACAKREVLGNPPAPLPGSCVV